MIAEYQKKSNIGVGIGVVLWIAGYALSNTSEAGVVVGLLLMLAGAAVFVYGCFMFAQGKGYPAVLGLLGLLGIIGLLILVVMPDKHKAGAMPPPPPPPPTQAA